ncbi:MAG: hypothetical protein RLZZ401_2157 [Pseudomonadota bacterium]|jgi:hypothetical protein
MGSLRECVVFDRHFAGEAIMGFFESSFSHPHADDGASGHRHAVRHGDLPPADPASAPVPTQPMEPDAALATDRHHPGFLKSAFGNPEAGVVYGTGNDYESEEELKADTKIMANQSFWYLGALAVFLLLGYWLSR